MSVFGDSQWVFVLAAATLLLSQTRCSPAVGPCSKTCGGGWRVVRDASDRTTLESCNSAACVVNVLSDWGAWSRCALHRAGGDSGVRYRYRDCPHRSTDRAFVHCAGEQIQFRDCDTAAGAGDGPVSSQPEPELLAEHAPRRGRLLDVDYIGAPRWSTGDAARRARSGGGGRGTSGRAAGAGPPAPASVRRQVDIDCVLDCLRQDDCARITAACVTKRHAPAGHNDLRRFLQTYMNDKLNPAAGLGRLDSTPGHDSDTALGHDTTATRRHGRARRSIREVYENTKSHDFFIRAIFICAAFIGSVGVGVGLGCFFLSWRRYGYTPFRFRRKSAKNTVMMDGGRMQGADITQL